jgi:hypothetical protein
MSEFVSNRPAAGKAHRARDRSDGEEIKEGKGAKVRITYDDARRGAVELDANADEVDDLARRGQKVARRVATPGSKTTMEKVAEALPGAPIQFVGHGAVSRTGVAVRARRLVASNVSGVPRPRERVDS